MNEDLKYIIRNTIYRSGFSVSQMEGNTWVFTESGLRCLTCVYDDEDDDDEYYYSGNFNKSFEVGSFSGLEIGDDFIVNIKQADSFSVNLSGEEVYIQEVTVENDGGFLIIGFDEDMFHLKKKNRGIEVNVALPTLEEVHFSGVCKAYINDFDLDNLKLVLSGVSVTEGSLNVEGNLEVELKGAAKLTLEGSGNYLNVQLSGGSVLNSLYYESENVEIVANGASAAKVYSGQTIDARSRGSSNIQYRGDPSRTTLDEQTGSSISEY